MLRPLAVFATLAATAGAASAQDRVAMDDVPDVDLYAGARDGLAIELFAGTDGHRRFVDDVETDSGVAAIAGLRVGAQPDPNRRLYLRSDLALSDGGDDFFDVRGGHRLVALYGFGDPAPGRVFADVGVDHTFDHGAEPLPGGPADVGPASFVDSNLEVTSWIGRMQDGKVGSKDIGQAAFAAVRRRDVHYFADSAPIDGASTIEVTAGFGVRPYHAMVLSGSRNVLWASRARTTIGEATIDRTEVWLGGKDLVLRIGDDLVVGLTQAVGWSRTNAGGGRGASMLAIEDVASVRSRRASASLGFSRRPSLTPDGARLIADWRATAMVEAVSRTGVGGSVRVVANILDDLESDVDNARRYFFHHELFADVGGDTRVGLYHLARLAPPRNTAWDPWDSDRRWSNDIGLFVRWTPIR